MPAKKRPREDREEPQEEGSDEEDEVADIEAFARTQLREGDKILGEGVPSGEAEARGICNAPLILRKLADIEYPVPPGAKRVPWIDTLAIDLTREIPKGVNAKDGVKLEGAFRDLAGDAVKEGYRRLRVMKVPATRPTDFYAEMLKTDEQMYKVRALVSEESRRIKVVEDRKSAKSAKQFQKKARAKKAEVRAAEKSKSLKDIKEWKVQHKQDTQAGEDKDLETVLARNSRNRLGEDDKGKAKGKGKGKDDKGKGKGTRKERKFTKQNAKDEKYGYGGKKRGSKRNSFDSFNEGGRAKGKGKGKERGKGKGKGSKGKGGGGGVKKKSKMR